MIGVVPARGGSKGLRHKNLLTVDGVPLVINAANALREFLSRVLVCTEDPQIASVARLHGYEVLDRPPSLSLDDVDVGAVMDWVTRQLGGPCIMHQPTVYSPSLAYLGSFIERANTRGRGWGVAVVPSGHIVWPSADVVPDRRQRQDLLTWPATEIGVRWYGDMWQGYYAQPVHVTDTYPIFDIDTAYDLDAARRASMRKGKVVMSYVSNVEVGQGHKRRVEAVADELQHLDVSTIPSKDISHHHPSVVVHDRLDSSEFSIADLKAKGARVITVEDLGPGHRHADAVINALYDRTHAQYAVLRPEFRSLPPYEVKPTIENILVTFGGTDPSHYTETVLNYFRKHSNVSTRVVAPPGRNVPEYANNVNLTTLKDPNMAEEMARADLVITSAGRTIFEAGAVGVPVLCAAQNLREARHAHLGPASGNIFMGLGLDMDVVSRNVNLLGSQRLREEMSEAGRKLSDGRGAERIARIVEDLL